MIHKTLPVFLLIISLLAYPSAAQKLEAYQLFDKNGVKTDFGALVQASASTEVVLFGELHNNPISHWLQLKLTMALFDLRGEQLMLGMEMFEADDQIIIDEYFAGIIAERNFRAEARLWNNYNTDIRPLVELARENGLRLIATNIPRRYAALVNRQGFQGLEQLSAQALQWVAPLPVPYDPELSGYKAMLEMEGLPAHTSANFPKAQAIKDATMAHFIMENLGEENSMIHFHGAYHSNNYEGILWYLQQRKPEIEFVTISTVEQSQVETLDENNKGIADFIIAVPQTMTKTY